MSHPFGDLLRQYRARKAGLSQTRLAELAGYDQAVLVRMSQGKKDLTGPSGRERVVRLIAVLRDAGALTALSEANAFLKAAGMAPLFEGQAAEREIIQSLHNTSVVAATAAPMPASPMPASLMPASLMPASLMPAPPVPFSTPVHFTPPAPLTPLIGREREVGELVELLSPFTPTAGGRVKAARLVTLTGTAGSGKTRLALELAGRLTPHYTHGACFVELAPVQQVDDVVPTLARALDVLARSDVSALDTLKQFLRHKSLLLVLDNFEHLLDAGSAITALLMAAPDLQVLTTSREPLRVSGEYVAFVEPLAVAAAVELFAERARAVKPTFALRGVEGIVADICRRVDCLPLAVELAAARARQFPPKVLLAQLGGEALGGQTIPRTATDPGGLSVLSAGPRDAPSRHRSLRNALEWSYGLLNADEQRLFRSLGVFAGGAEIDQIRRIGNSMILQSLVDKNLVRADEQPDDTARYGLHEVVREFALEKLADQGELDAVHHAHAEAFSVLAEEAEPHIHDREQRYWVPRLEREHNNIRAALSWSLTPAGDPQLGLRLASRMWLFWGVRHTVEGSRWLRKLLDAAGPQAPAFTRGRAMLGYTNAGSVFVTSTDEMKALLEEALRLLRSVDDEEGVTFALFTLGTIEPEDERVLQLAKEGKAFERWRGNRLGLEWAAFRYLLRNINLEDASRHFSETLEGIIQVASDLGDLEIVALALRDKCFNALYCDDLPLARALGEQALSTARTIGARDVETVVLHLLGEIMELTGDLDGAQRCMEECLQVAEQYGWPDAARAQALAILGKVARDRGDYATAHAHFVESLQAPEPDFQPRWWQLEGLSCVASAQGRHARAARLLGAAEADRQQRNDPWWEKDLRDLAPYIAQARAGLGDEAYEVAYAEGQCMTWDQAVAYALASAPGSA